MSKKYTPSFLKNQSQGYSQGQGHTQGQGQTSNKFSVLSDEFSKVALSNTVPSSVVPSNTFPLKEVKLATLASLTSTGTTTTSTTTTGGTRSFAAKFADQAKSAEQYKMANKSNYVAPPKPVDVASSEDFPSLGGGTKKNMGWKKDMNTVATAVTVATVATAATTISFADKAKEWAMKKEEEEETTKLQAIVRAEYEAKMRREEDILRKLPTLPHRRTGIQYDYDDEEDNNSAYNDDPFSEDSDSFEVPNGDEEPSEEEDEEEDGEFNQNVGWDGRRKDDLY